MSAENHIQCPQKFVEFFQKHGSEVHCLIDVLGHGCIHREAAQMGRCGQGQRGRGWRRGRKGWQGTGMGVLVTLFTWILLLQVKKYLIQC